MHSGIYDPYGNRTHVARMKIWSLNRLTKGPDDEGKINIFPYLYMTPTGIEPMLPE